MICRSMVDANITVRLAVGSPRAFDQWRIPAPSAARRSIGAVLVTGDLADAYATPPDTSALRGMIAVTLAAAVARTCRLPHWRRPPRSRNSRSASPNSRRWCSNWWRRSAKPAAATAAAPALRPRDHRGRRPGQAGRGTDPGPVDHAERRAEHHVPADRLRQGRRHLHQHVGRRARGQLRRSRLLRPEHDPDRPAADEGTDLNAHIKQSRVNFGTDTILAGGDKLSTRFEIDFFGSRHRRPARQQHLRTRSSAMPT